MKHVFATAILLVTMGTASFACSTEEFVKTSKSISDITNELVKLDPANLGEVQKIMQAAAITEYHNVSSEAVCARQHSVLEALIDFSANFTAEESAMLKDDQF